MKTKRRFGVMSILVVMAVLVSLLAVGSTVAAQEEKEALSGGTGSTFVVTNGIYTLSVEDVPGSDGIGTFTISTGAAHPNPNENVFYGGAGQSPWSTYLTVRVYDTLKEYVSTTSGPAPSPGYSVEALDTCSPLVTAIDNTVITTWTIAGTLVVEQVIAIEGTTLSDSRVRVTTTVTNEDDIAHSVGMRYEWDIMIDGIDGAYCRERNPDGPWLDVETEWVSPAFERYEITNDPAAPIFSVFGTASGPAVLAPTPPDLLQFADWGDIYSYAFDYTPTGQVIGGSDSAIAYYWGNNEDNKITLAPGESVSVTALVFAVPPVNTPPSTCPVTVTNLESPTPTINWAYFDVEGAPQAEYEVEVWTDPGGTGTNMWDPPIGVGTDTSVVYAGDPFTLGVVYHARVRAYDGTDWGDWCETDFTIIPPVFYLSLEPESAVNEPGETHTLTATLVDEDGNPIAGEEITFTVTGANPTSGTADTNASGVATWGYTGTNPGDDTIVATNGGETSNRALKTWTEEEPPPPKVPGITGWGILAAVLVLAGLMLTVMRRRGLLKISKSR